jgi:hypothetical protein
VAKEQVAARQLIDDRELQDWDEDRFRHSDVALQLAELAATVKTPANVGLYGAWGSGKTGIANLLRSQLRDPSFRAKYGDIQFARFDAFKYAEVPLRRHFLVLYDTLPGGTGYLHRLAPPRAGMPAVPCPLHHLGRAELRRPLWSVPAVRPCGPCLRSHPGRDICRVPATVPPGACRPGYRTATTTSRYN